MTFFFGYLFEPFEVYLPELKMNYFWITFIHALTPAIITSCFSMVKITTKTEENWTIKKEAFLIASFLIIIGIAQFLIRDLIYNNPNNWSWRYLNEEIRNTFLVGMLFSSILISLNFNRLNFQNNRKAKSLNSSKNFTEHIYPLEHIANVKINDLQLDINNLLFAKAEGNYVEFYLKEEKTSKVLTRITIKELETILTPYPNIIKTHRSYLVNSKYIKNVIGNAQGYKLQLNNYDGKIPVSRNMIAHFDAQMKA